MLKAVQTRLESRVPELENRVDLAAEFARLRESGRGPVGGVACFVLPSGTTGLQARASSGLFVQDIRLGVSVVTMLQSTDATGQRALDRIDEFLKEIQRALCGWAPTDTVGVFELASERPVPQERGTLAFLTDFRINDQLRIPT
ncbi:MAG: phage tail terminator protein [Pelagimonas sp.]|uniref:phage tail terminator protein n=1 Tax=Pelagimonas sp. TaxID=2073170 RepID=UPI003D6B774E